MKLRLLQSWIVMLALGVVAPLEAQEYPAKPVRMVVPFPPGAAVDLTARLLQQHMATGLGQPVIIENRAGNAGVIGMPANDGTPRVWYSIIATP